MPDQNDFSQAPSADGQATIQLMGEVHFADIDAVMAEDRIGRCQVKIDVRDRHLQHVILAADNLPCPQEMLTLRSPAPAYCASSTLSAKATVLRIRARSSSSVCSVSACRGRCLP